MELIVKKYTDIDDSAKICPSPISESDLPLFRSMERAHKNIHLIDTQLESLLSDVNQKNLLDVKERMIIPKTLKSFLNAKSKKTSLQDQLVNFNELFESLLPHIKDLYDEKLKSRDCLDEFGLEAMENNYDVGRLTAGMHPDDSLFYGKFFVPAAFFYVYKEIHVSNSEDEVDLLSDLFTLGSGAKTYDLLPEITVACQTCATNFLLGKESVEILNRRVFHQQKSDKFMIDGLSISESDESNSFLASKTKLSDEESAFNPFEAGHLCDDASIQVDEVPGVVCSLCPKMFSKLDFLEYHKSVFHKEESKSLESNMRKQQNYPDKEGNKVVRPCFVDDKDPELMKTFIDESTLLDVEVISEAAEQDVGEKNTPFEEGRSRRGVRKILKYPKC